MKKKKIKKADTSKNRTYVAIVLDRSGSMAYPKELKERTVIGYNEQVQQIKANATEGEYFVSLVTFNGEVYEHIWNAPAEELKESTMESYKPGGATALLDAEGYVIDKLLRTTDPTDENNAYLVIVITDGHENSSLRFKADRLKSMKGDLSKWTFTYMGCDASYIERLARSTGTAVANCLVSEDLHTGSGHIGLTGGMANTANTKRTARYLRSRNSVAGAYASSMFYSDTPGEVLSVCCALDVDALDDLRVECVAGEKTDVFGKGGTVDWSSVKSKTPETPETPKPFTPKTPLTSSWEAKKNG